MGRALHVKAALAALAAMGMAVGVASADPIAVTTTNNANTLANNIAGSGITINSATYVGAAGAAGTYTNATPALGAGTGSGIVLSTGLAQGVVGPNTSPSFTGVNNTAGDANLTALVGATTNDAASLTINFTPVAGTVSFQFVFGSEEYNEYVNSQYNDAFAFFLNGVNIALIPGTNAPVTINSVNAGSNSAYFFNNTGGARDIQFDGLVGAGIPLFATGAVNAGVNNTLKIVVADTSDFQYDSAVFIGANSFTDTPPPGVPLPGVALAGMALMGCTGVSKLRRRRATV
jgi:hypothetical protein